jgi:hypothetical protein
VIGAFLVRRSWRVFRKRFDDLRLSPLLNYKLCQEEQSRGQDFRFVGGLESITDDQTLWVRNSDITIPVDLKNAHIYLLPNIENDRNGSSSSHNASSERIKLNRLSSLKEGAKVYVGGVLDTKNGRLTFLSTKEHPLLIIFYDGSRRNLSVRIIRASRQKNEYWNEFTPYSLAFGAFLELMYAFNFIARPAFQLTLIVAIIAMLGPLFPVVPPGIILTNIYSRLWRKARNFRSYRDVFRLPLKYLQSGTSQSFLPNGEKYGFLKFDHLPSWIQEDDISYLPAELRNEKTNDWYVFGTLTENDDLPLEIPHDPFAVRSAFPDEPEKLAKVYAKKAHIRGIISFIIIGLGIVINCIFIILILYLFMYDTINVV